MNLHPIDLGLVIIFVVAMLWLGVALHKRATSSVDDYFLAGRKLPWWMIGFANVASYTGSSAVFVLFVFSHGIVGNWLWWGVWIIWMPLMTILWAKIWRRLRIMTDAELLEVRYGGPFAKFLRVTIAVYICFFFAVIGMGLISTWLSTTVQMITGVDAWILIVLFAFITFVYTLLGGLLGIAYTDIPQFLIYLLANIILVPFCVAGAGGFSEMYATVREVRGESFFSPLPPSADLPALTLMAFFIQGLLTVASSATAQKFAAAKNEFHAIMGQALSTVLSLVVRVFPLIILGIAASALYPADFAEPGNLYGMMIVRFAPVGLIGLLIVAELAGYMSTMDTLMNWGSSLFINDVYRRFMRKGKGDKHYVRIGQIATGVMTAGAILVAIFFVETTQGWFLYLNSVIGAFGITAGIMRFCWWRFNKYGEFAGIFIGAPVGWYFWFNLEYQHEPFWMGFGIIGLLGLCTMVLTTLLTPAENNEKLVHFYAKCLPFGIWGPIRKQVKLSPEAEKLRDYKADALDVLISILFSASLVTGANALLGLWFWLAAGCGVMFTATGALLLYRWNRRGFLASLQAADVDLAPDEYLEGVAVIPAQGKVADQIG